MPLLTFLKKNWVGKHLVSILFVVIGSFFLAIHPPGFPCIKDKSENSEEGVLIPGLDNGVVPVGLKLRLGLTISSFGLIHCLPSWSLEVSFSCVKLFITVASGAAAELLFSDGPVKPLHDFSESVGISLDKCSDGLAGCNVLTFLLIHM